MHTSEPMDTIRNKVKEAVMKVLTPSEVEVEELKEEVWQDLSALYYKYEDEDHKKAFREVLHEISEKIEEGKWNTVYKKLYREEQKEKPL